MKYSITLVHEEPNIESTIPLPVYQSSSPEKFSLDDDKFILYAGGTNYKLELLKNDPTQTVEICNELVNLDFSNISIYSLNTAFILWFNNGNIGLSIPYQVIILHALKDHKLYLQLMSSEFLKSIRNDESEFISSVELTIEYNDTKVIRNGLIQEDSTIEELYEGMSKCSSFHYDEDSDEEDLFQQTSSFQEEPRRQLEIPSSWVEGFQTEEVSYINVGDADDLESYEYQDANNDDLEPVAGMSVDIGFGPIAGSIRKREDDLEHNKKSRKLF